MKKPTKPVSPYKPSEPQLSYTQKSRSWYGTANPRGETSIFYNSGRGVDPTLFDLTTLSYTLEINYDEPHPPVLEFSCDYKEPIVVKNSMYDEHMDSYTLALERYSEELTSYLLELERYNIDLDKYELQQLIINAGENALREKLVSAGLTDKEIETTLKGRNNE